MADKKLLKRWMDAVEKIGPERLLNLPEPVKELLRGTSSLEIKTEMLERIAREL